MIQLQQYRRILMMLRWLFDKLRRKKIIVIAPRWNDIWVGSDKICGTGKSVKEALGDIVLNHPKEFGIQIKLAFGGKPMKPLGTSYISIAEEEYDNMMRATGWNRD